MRQSIGWHASVLEQPLEFLDSSYQLSVVGLPEEHHLGLEK